MTGSKNKNLYAYLLFALAVIALGFAIICFVTDTSKGHGGYEMSEAYGGDAYTGIQNAAAQTANNVQTLSMNVELLTKCVATASGLFFLLASFTFAVAGVRNLCPQVAAAVTETQEEVSEEE